METTILIIISIIIAYGFGFFSGSICMAEDNAKVHNSERKKAFNFAFKHYNYKNKEYEYNCNLTDDQKTALEEGIDHNG
tara:strand:- start:35 stop:271 length:237 start_codon:yes stop_codon:yes gene_type:complete